FTIPMMKRAGYTPVAAGAIEALASTGSQLVPPIMGAAAFIMAELTRIPYWTIAVAAIIPSVLYYVVVYAAVHFESIRSGLGTMQDERKPMLKLLVSRGYMFLPIVVIIYYLGSGYSITLSATMAILASFFVSVIPIVAKREWKELHIFVQALEDGAKSSIAVAVPCAIAGIIVGVLTLTGLGLKFTEIILSVAGTNILWLLLITSLICLVLGMGMPTSAAYITVAILAIPALIKGGMPVLTAHFFGFYFANLSMVTPPVALAAYAGAGIADANSSTVGVKACTMGLTLYIIPFLLATYPPLMLFGEWWEVAFAIFKAGLIVIAFTAAIMGIFSRRLNGLERLLFAGGGIILWLTIYPVLTNIVGFALLAAAIAMTRKGRETAVAV
ncbi:MAG: TRAP transporter fused permease subunit, partial [Pseudomonadota bacterium]